MPAPWASRCSSDSRATCGCGCTSACTARGTSRATSCWTRRSRRRTAAWGRRTRRARSSTVRTPMPWCSTRAGENSLTSIGAPRRTRLRMSESEKEGNALDTFPPEPIGQVRVRLLTDTIVADLRGPDRVRGARPRPGRGGRRRSSVPTRCSTRGPRPKTGSRGDPCKKPTADRAAAHGPERRRRHRQRVPRRAPLPRATEPAHAGQAGARGARAPPLARLGEAARHRRRDRADDDHGRPRPRGVPRRDGQPRRPALGLQARGPAVPGLRHEHRARGDWAAASSTGAPTARREPAIPPAR